MSVKKLAILGAAHGHISYVTDALATRSDVELVALADHDVARRASYGAKLGVPGYADMTSLLARHDIDAAAVIAEPGLRAGLIEACLERGLFVIADKPLALTVEEVERIAKADGGRNRVALMLEKRFYPVTRKARELFLGGEIGDLVAITSTGPHKLLPSARPAWFFDPSLYGSIVNDLAVHDIDLVLWLTGARSGRVSGWKSPACPEKHAGFALAGRALLTLETGLQAVIDMDWRQPEAAARHGDYAMRLIGTRGRMDILFGEGRLLVETDSRSLWEPDLPAPIGPADDALDALTGKAPLQVSTAEALLASCIAALAAASAEEGGHDYRW
ncbi:Gfo/Idh/MocA family protein [Rhizobium sp. BR 314]|uniref:Gfo/Idh/MocA family protein n=1 Tax=Rhizobium sp. BR 314 TaxID=3040013 RepID=UPI0039BF133F